MQRLHERWPELVVSVQNMGGIDAMAVEVERISEGQRFTTKLLADRQPERLGR